MLLYGINDNKLVSNLSYLGVDQYEEKNESSTNRVFVISIEYDVWEAEDENIESQQ